MRPHYVRVSCVCLVKGRLGFVSGVDRDGAMAGRKNLYIACEPKQRMHAERGTGYVCVSLDVCVCVCVCTYVRMYVYCA